MKKIVRYSSYVVGSILLFLIIGILLFTIFFPTEKARLYAIEKGEEQLGRDITIETAEVSIWGGLGVKLGNVAISNPDGYDEAFLLAAENIDVKLKFWPLLTGDMAVDRLIINEPDIFLYKGRDGSNNYTFEQLDKKVPQEIAESATPETKAAAAAVSFDNLQINDGNITYQNDSTDFFLMARGIQFTTNLVIPDDGIYHSRGTLRVDSLLSSKTTSLPSLEVSLNYNADFNYPRQSLTFENTDLIVNKVKVELNGDLTDLFGRIGAKVNIQSEQVDVNNLLSLLTDEQKSSLTDISLEGDIEVDADILYNSTDEEPLTYFGSAEIHDVSAAYADITGELQFKNALIDFKNDNVRLTIEDGYFDNRPVKGHMAVSDFSDPLLNGEIAGALDLAYIQPFFKDTMEHEVSGLAEFSVKVYGHPKEYRQLDITGSAKISDGRYNSKFMIEPIDTLDLDLYFDKDITLIKKMTAVTKSGKLLFDGRVQHLMQYFFSDSLSAQSINPAFEGNLSGTLDLSVLNELLPPKGNPSMTGMFTLDINVQGDFNNYLMSRPRGTVTIANASYADSLLPEPITNFETRMKIEPDTITVYHIKANFESSDVLFEGRLIRPFPYLLPLKTINRSKLQKPLFLFKLYSSKFDSDKLFPEAVPGAGGEEVDAVSKDSVSAIILPDIDGSGLFLIDTLIYNKIEFTAIKGTMKIENRIIECTDVIGMVYSGEVAGETTIDLNDITNPKYTGNYTAKQIEANDFLSRFTPIKDHLFGKFDLDGDFTASGWEPDKFFESLTMNSSVVQQNGRLVTSGPVYEVINNFGKTINQPIDKEQTLRNLKTFVTVEDGRVSMDKLTTRLGNLGDMEFAGSYGFDGKVKYDGKVLLSEQLSEKLQSKTDILSSILKPKSISRISLPLVIDGTVENPNLKIDTKALKEALGESVTDELESILDKISGGK